MRPLSWKFKVHDLRACEAPLAAGAPDVLDASDKKIRDTLMRHAAREEKKQRKQERRERRKAHEEESRSGGGVRDSRGHDEGGDAEEDTEGGQALRELWGSFDGFADADGEDDWTAEERDATRQALEGFREESGDVSEVDSDREPRVGEAAATHDTGTDTQDEAQKVEETREKEGGYPQRDVADAIAEEWHRQKRRMEEPEFDESAFLNELEEDLQGLLAQNGEEEEETSVEGMEEEDEESLEDEEEVWPGHQADGENEHHNDDEERREDDLHPWRSVAGGTAENSEFSPLSSSPSSSPRSSYFSHSVSPSPSSLARRSSVMSTRFQDSQALSRDSDTSSRDLHASEFACRASEGSPAEDAREAANTGEPRRTENSLGAKCGDEQVDSHAGNRQQIHASTTEWQRGLTARARLISSSSSLSAVDASPLSSSLSAVEAAVRRSSPQAASSRTASPAPESSDFAPQPAIVSVGASPFLSSSASSAPPQSREEKLVRAALASVVEAHQRAKARREARREKGQKRRSSTERGEASADETPGVHREGRRPANAFLEEERERQRAEKEAAEFEARRAERLSAALALRLPERPVRTLEELKRLQQTQRREAEMREQEARDSEKRAAAKAEKKRQRDERAQRRQALAGEEELLSGEKSWKQSPHRILLEAARRSHERGVFGHMLGALHSDDSQAQKREARVLRHAGEDSDPRSEHK
ncbi:UNVERIFIED_CONTAM: S1 RNA binding domain protein, putative [Hammondia hammondi]|eukprot:XP_008889264.1 S1 RNA binding domain protein, putative [Hammondia hammondi]